MSVVGERTVIISVGASCQTSEQIRRHLDLIRALTDDDTIEARAFPFDGVIAPPRSVAKALGRRNPFPPVDQLEYHIKPYWRRCNIYYWHHFLDGETLARGDRLDHFAAAYKRRAKRFRQAVQSEKRLIFIVSNTQPDLVEKSRETGTFEPVVTDRDMRALHGALTTLVGRPFGLALVTTSQRYRGRRWGQPFRTLFQPETAASPGNAWQGDDAAWAYSLRQLFRPSMLERLIERLPIWRPGGRLTH